jgi:hypothetical protein
MKVGIGVCPVEKQAASGSLESHFPTLATSHALTGVFSGVSK